MENEKPSRTGDGKGLAFNPVQVSEHIESCRAHAANLSGHAHIAAQALHECIEYEPHEPHLGTCMDVAVQMLDQVHVALSPLTIVSHDADPQIRAAEIYAGCEAQRRTLNRAQHITLATIYILESSELDRTDDTDEIVESLREIDEGIRTVIRGLLATTTAAPCPPADCKAKTSTQAPLSREHAELFKTANHLRARTINAASIAGEVARSLPTEFNPASLKPNLGLCCQLLRLALLETGHSLEGLAEGESLPTDAFIITCDRLHQQLRACLSVAMAIGELMRPTSFDDERLLFSGLIPELDEQAQLLEIIKAGAKTPRK